MAWCLSQTKTLLFLVFWHGAVSHTNRWTSSSGGTQHRKSWPELQLPNCRIWGIVLVFPVFKSSHEETITTSFSKRSKIRSLRFLGMASMSREPLSRQCLPWHYRRQQILLLVVLKGAVLKIPSVCQESKWTTFGASCASYIRCTFLMILSVKHPRVYDKILQHRPNTCRRIWWVGWSAKLSN